MNLEDIMPCEISQAQKKKTPSSHVECKKKLNTQKQRKEGARRQGKWEDVGQREQIAVMCDK